MRNGHALKIAMLLAAGGLATGCSQIGTTFPRRTSMGTLKTSLSHLEFENEQLRKEVAKLKTDTREIEDRLVQEETDNGDLKARLDDARHLLSQKGIDLGDDASGSAASNRQDGPADPPTTLPAGQSSRKRRKAPFTQIPGRIEMAPPSDPADDDPFVAPKAGARDEFGPQSMRGDAEVWLPIAQGTSAPTARAKTQ
jgi:hypothetical protein